MAVYTQGSIRTIIGGPGSLSELPARVSALGGKNVLLITDPKLYAAGLVAKPLKLLEDAGFLVSVVSDVPPEPSAAQVQGIFDKASAVKGDIIVAVGGGSVMDTAKLVAILLTNRLTLADLIKGTKPAVRGVPTVMVPTTAGTGSEATPNAIVLVPEENLKVGIVSELMIADCAILDPEITAGLPPAITANTGIDALCHLMECYISKKANPFSDAYALAGIELVARSLRRCCQNGRDLEAREMMLNAACYGGICIASSSTTAIHALSYPLGGRYHIPHGLANAILMPLVMDANRGSCDERYVRMAAAIGINTAGRSAADVTDDFVKELYALNRDLGIRCDLASLGVTEAVIDELVAGASKVTRLLGNNPKDLSAAEMADIYRKLIAANK